MRHLPVIDNSGCIAGIITRKNLMTYLLTEQNYRELSMIIRVQRAARRFFADRKKKYERLFKMFVQPGASQLSESEVRALVLHYRSKFLLGGGFALAEEEETNMMEKVWEEAPPSRVIHLDELPPILLKVRHVHVASKRYMIMLENTATHSLAMMTEHASDEHAEKEFQMRQNIRMKFDHQ